MKNLFISLLSDDNRFTSFFTNSTPLLGPFIIGQYFAEPDLPSINSDCSDILVVKLQNTTIESLYRGLAAIKRKNQEMSVLVIGPEFAADVIKHLIRIGVEGILFEREIGTSYSRAITSLMKGRKFLSKIYLTSVIGAFRVNLHNRILSRRELLILEKLGHGNTYHEISSELYISYFTTKSHLRHIYKKLNARNKEEALFKARMLRLIN